MAKSSKATDKDWKYPIPKALKSGHLATGDGLHKVYWHEYGNPKGEPVMYLHGGPGGGTEAGDARFFNPKRYRVVLFDQRGCGKSKPNAATDPVAALRHNTTGHLIEDIEALRKHLGIKGKMHVFGGSWGSTLALAYAIAHPSHVQSLVLRGIFLCRTKDLDYFYQGNAEHYHQNPYDTRLPGTYLIYPEEWKPFVEMVPKEKRRDMVKAYAEIFTKTPRTPAETKAQNLAAKTWAVWEGSTLYLAPDSNSAKRFSDPAFSKAFARLENHYFMNGAFLGGSGEANRKQNYILKNVGKISHLPIHVVHGMYDEVCPRFQADELVYALRAKGAKVNYVLTRMGHSGYEIENMKALTAIMDGLPKMLKI